jgi:hypothetical protein
MVIRWTDCACSPQERPAPGHFLSARPGRSHNNLAGENDETDLLLQGLSGCIMIISCGFGDVQYQSTTCKCIICATMERLLRGNCAELRCTGMPWQSEKLDGFECAAAEVHRQYKHKHLRIAFMQLPQSKDGGSAVSTKVCRRMAPQSCKDSRELREVPYLACWHRCSVALCSVTRYCALCGSAWKDSRC